MKRLHTAFATLCTFLLGSTLSAYAGEPIAEIPYRMDYDGWITVDVMVNGNGPYDFIIDSGATLTSAFTSLAIKENFEVNDHPPIRVLGLTDFQHLPAYSFGDLQIANQFLSDHIGVVLPDWEPLHRSPDGILGLDFLTRYAVMFNAETKTVRLYDPTNLPNEPLRKWSHAALIPDGFGQDSDNLHRIRVNIQGHRISCLLDLGASGTLLNYPALRRLFSGIRINRNSEPGFLTGTRLMSIFDDDKKARLVRITRVGIADAIWKHRTFVVFNPPIFEELGVHNKPFCLLGSDLMTERRFMLDFANERLYIDHKKSYQRAPTG